MRTQSHDELNEGSLNQEHKCVIPTATNSKHKVLHISDPTTAG